MYLPVGNYRLTVPHVIGESITLAGAGRDERYEGVAVVAGARMSMLAPYLTASVLLMDDGRDRRHPAVRVRHGSQLSRLRDPFADPIKFHQHRARHLCSRRSTTPTTTAGCSRLRLVDVKVFGRHGNPYAYNLVNFCVAANWSICAPAAAVGCGCGCGPATTTTAT